MDAEAQREASRRMTEFVLTSPEYRETQTLFVYIDAKQEISTAEILADAWKQGKTVAAPRVEGETMDFYVIRSEEDLEPGSFGIREPKAECPRVEDETGLFLAPGVAFDYSGHRVGYGGGYYDRYLAAHPGHRVWGLAYECQLCDAVPTEETDLPMEQIVTEKGFRKKTEETLRQQYYMDEIKTLLKAQAQELGRPLTACICTFGCQMNARDSEKLLGILKEIGFEESESEEADFVLYNTCTVRENANLRVYGRLGHLNSLKKKNPRKIIALCGCMMQEKDVVEKIQTSYRFVDIVFGTHNIFRLAELLYRRLTEGKQIVEIWEGTERIVEDLPVERKYPFKSGVNIMFGCNNFCSYCIVPYVRGRERSREPEDILREIRSLVADGVVEVMLLGQNVNSYGKNLAHPITFAALLEQVEAIEGLERIRFMTSHPKDLSDELIAVMAKSKKICRHLHLPLQSGSTRILHQMNRKYTKEQYLALVEKIKKAIPDISLTTDIIVGFPGETEEDFEETMDVVRKVRYDSAFTFIYSKRTGTPAAAMEEQVPLDVVQPRFDRLLAEVQKIAGELCGRDTGTVQTALVEGIDTHDTACVTGRLSNNLMVHFPGDASLIGKLVSVRLTEAKGFYYMGRMEE
ncbi:tRNA (N6-isopentenyl adenosine(37)-C2)-methylthiotransferase MiaB [Hominifimenecus sp. rT4P-3]|uniref:tRNA (N6-isopentenyl adenosine(37)-C2)-methylthiotransferase MiaB n=1 Tax=Hominifimenecus sp. rT4P-3 TaxID=3242979 RepID=UPI003DA6CC86